MLNHAYTAVEALIAAVVAIPIVGGFAWLFRKFAREQWEGKFVEGDHEYVEEVSIYRMFGRIIGKSVLTYDQNGKKLIARYRIRGVLKHAILTAYFEGLDNSERGAFLIKYSISNDDYAGKYLLIDHADGISMVEYSWTRP